MAASSIAAAVRPTTYRATSSTTPGSYADTIASTGASMKRSPSAVRSPTTGAAIRPAIDTHRKSSITAAIEASTTRRRPRRPTRISPARPDAASTPITATVAMPVAKIRSCQPGATPRSIEELIAPGSQYWANPITDTPTSTAMLKRESRRTAPSRWADRPRMFCIATSKSAAPAITSGSAPSSSSFQKTARYSETTTAPIAITIR
jgi:hypothetical protein